MKIPSDIKYIRKISKEIENFLKPHKVSDSVLFDIRLCFEEALKNAILHGNNAKRDLPVFVSYSLNKDRFTMEIEDQGKGFNPDKNPDPTKGKGLLKEGGRGVFLIQKLMDEVEYCGRGNKVVMVKYIGKSKGGNDAD